MSVLNGVFSLGYVVGNILGGQLYRAYGSYYLNFGLSLALALAGAGYAAVFVRESVTGVEPDVVKRTRFFDWANVRDSFGTALRERPGTVVNFEFGGNFRA